MKKFTKLLKEKRWRWTAGGIMCLVVAAMIFALSADFSAEADTITIGEQSFIQDTDGSYLIDSAEKMIALSNATSGTNGTFKLTEDITVSVSAPATGIFEGTFDGNGHVITINSAGISSNKAGEVSQGLLFGTVSDNGTVKNVIIDFTGDISYTRTSLGELVLDETKPMTYVVSNPTNSAPDLSNTNEIQIDGEYYKEQELLNVDATAKKYYKLVAGNDYFGLLCGKNHGTIQQVYLADTSTGNVKATISRGQSQTGIPTEYTLTGKADVKYRYKRKEETNTQNASGSVTLSGTAYDGSNSNVSNSVDGLSLKVAAPKAVNGNLITYQVEVTGATGTEFKLMSTVTGITFADKYEIPATGSLSTSISYTIPQNTTSVAMNITATEVLSGTTDETQTAKTVTVSNINTNVYSSVVQNDQEIIFSGISGLIGTLKKPNTNVVVSGNDSSRFTYMLTLKNNNNTAVTISKEGLVDWTLNNSPISAEFEIPAAGSVELKKEVPITFNEEETQFNINESVSMKGTLTTLSYTYVFDSSMTIVEKFVITDGATETPVSGSEKTSINNLYAGAIAGLNTGNISESKQTVDMIGATSSDGFALGGITGSATSGTLKDIYMLGKVNGGGVYVGTGTVSPTGSANTSQNSIPSGGENWTTFDEYSLSGETISKVTSAELEWLVKTTQFSYSDPTEENIITVSLNEDKKITSKELSGIAVGYTARKDLSVSENQAYYSNQGVIDLGASGFYKVLAAYATDGYYHYREDVSSSNLQYPYSGEGPFKVESARVVRSKVDPLEDEVELTISPRTTNGGKVYYVVNNTTALPGTGNIPPKDLSPQGIVTIPFKEASEQYRMVVVANDHIYPAFLSGTYTIDEKKELPKPKVSVFNYYNSNGEKNAYSTFGSSGTSYIAGEELLIMPYGNETTNYSFRYLFSEVAPVERYWETAKEEEYYNNRYIGKETEFDTLFEKNAIDYVDSAIIPTEFDEDRDVYLYVEISKKEYNSAIYCYGPIRISKKDTLKASLPSADGYTAINGDIMKINGIPQGATVEYFVSKTPTSSYNGTWNTYSSNTGIVMSESYGNYVYARIKYDSEKYSEWFEFACAFGGECAEPNITPNTGAATGNVETDTVIGSAVGSTTPISLSSRTANAHIFYLLSDAKQTMNLERVDKVPEEVTKDGDYNNAKTQRYFKVGERWYRTDNANVERYVESIHLFNDTANVKLAYISSVAVADGYKVSNARNYVYRIKQAQQVASPEAALETSCSPSTEKFEVANVALGSSLSFYSVTPEAELYYAIGSGTEEPTLKVPEGGIVVEGTYGENFVVRIQAKKEGMFPSEVISFVYKISDQEMASTPTATPGTSAEMPTVILPGNKILLSTDTKEALIYYTLDGSSPVVTVSEEGVFSSGNEATKLYDPTVGIDMPEEGKDYFTITAVAVKNGLAKSAEVHFTYSFPATVLAPYANFASGKVELNQVILLKSLTENAVIYYNVAYGETIPEDPTISSSVFNEAYPFTITQKTTIKAMAVKDNVKSEIVTFTFDPMAKLSAPTASIQSGSVVSRGTVLQLKADTGATIYYTMDGSDPMDSTNASVMMGDSLVLNGEAEAQITIKAYAVAPDKSKSEVVTFTYSFSQNSGGVTASIENGSTVSNGTKVNLISDVTDGDIYYTTDGSSPVSNGKKGTTVEIEGEPGSTFTVKAVVIVNDEPGTIATFIYKIQECPDAPTASPAGGTLTVATRVTLSAGTEKIYYTTDGTEPTKSSALYSEPILINRATVLKAIAVSEEGEISDVATFVYEAALKASSVKSSSADGDILEPGAQIYLSTTTDGAKIYYSTDGTEPNMDNLDSMLVYDGDFIEINRDVTIRAVAYRKDLRLSDVQTWSYFVDRIPAVEQKEAEAEKLAEEGLKDTDASELVRENVKDTEKVTKTVRERTYKTAVIYTSDAFQGNVALETIKEDDNPYAIKKAKGIYGDDTTVLESYKVKVKSGSSGVQPKEAVEIAFPIPKGYEDAALSVALVKDDYNLTTLETRREAKVLYVKTEKVGSYVIIGPERLNEEQSQFPYLLVLEVAAGITLACGLFFCLSEKIKKIKKNK